jgi:hypothetical protein
VRTLAPEPLCPPLLACLLSCINSLCTLALQVGKGRLYTPVQDDIGSILKCEVVSIDAASPFSEHGKTFSMPTSRVRPTPSPPKRALLPVTPAPWNAKAADRFTALTYNLLADLYATVSTHFMASLPGVFCERFS